MNRRTFVGAGDGPGVPTKFKPCLKNGVESGCVDPHRSDESTVVAVPVEAGPGCSKTGVGKEIHPSEVLSAGTPIAYRLCVILVGSHDKDRSKKVRPVRKLSLFVDFEVMPGGEVMEKETIVVHG